MQPENVGGKLISPQECTLFESGRYATTSVLANIEIDGGLCKWDWVTFLDAVY